MRGPKRASVTLVLQHGASTVRTFGSGLMRGDHTITWPLPRRGTYQVKLSAKSPNGLTSDTARMVRVPR